VNTRTALVVGASGLVGGHLLRLLLADPAYSRVTVLVRMSLGLHHPKLTECIIDFDQLQQHRDAVRGEDVFCCLGTTIKTAGSQEAFRKVDFTYVVQTAVLSNENGSRQFLLISSLGADAHSRIFYNRVKGEVEQAVSKLPFEAVKIFRPLLLLGERAESRGGEKAGVVLMKVLSIILIGNLKKYRAIEAQTVAKGMIRTAKEQRQGFEVIESDQIELTAQGY
jgi:uncharacterized protein YbjT (DUF2867 family)